MMIVTSNSTTTKPFITKFDSQFNDPYSKSSFFQQYQLIIFVAFIILCTGLILLNSLILIFHIMKTRRQKRYPSGYSQLDDYSDIFTFKRMNNKQEKFDYNTNINDNIVKHNLNNKEIESEMPLYYECTTLEHQTTDLPIKEITRPFLPLRLPPTRYQ